MLLQTKIHLSLFSDVTGSESVVYNLAFLAQNRLYLVFNIFIDVVVGIAHVLTHVEYLAAHEIVVVGKDVEVEDTGVVVEFFCFCYMARITQI